MFVFAILLASMLGYLIMIAIFQIIPRLAVKDPQPALCPRRITDILEARRILRDSTLVSRASPNQRLVRAFGIDNAFTTTDIEYHRLFVGQAKKLIRTSEGEWKALVDAAEVVVRTALVPLQDRKDRRLHQEKKVLPLSLAKMVQSVVFRIVIGKFFPVSEIPSEEDVDFVTKEINNLWIASKSCKVENPPDMLQGKHRLVEKLNSFIRPQVTASTLPSAQPIEDLTGRDNPLNWILPAYETLWRVVLHCFIETRFRSSTSDIILYKSTLNHFTANPSHHTFETPPSSGSLSSSSTLTTRHIINEALRLYPPTRRIHRQLLDEVVAIDVEGMHRDIEVWGADAEKFRPGRWEEEMVDNSEERKLAFMPFGMGKFECPAKNLFGPMMIGVLVGALMGGVDGEGREVEVCLDGVGGDAVNVFGEAPLDGGREAYVGLGLRMV